MAKIGYVAVIIAAPGVGYRVGFPDLPGLSVDAADMAEAFSKAHDALSEHLEALVAKDEALPEPSTLEMLTAAKAVPPEGAAGFVWVEQPDAAERVNVYLSKSLLERIDRHLAATGLNRSSFFNLAARRQLADDPMSKISDHLQQSFKRMTQELREPTESAQHAFRRASDELQPSIDGLQDTIRKFGDSLLKAAASRRAG